MPFIVYLGNAGHFKILFMTSLICEISEFENNIKYSKFLTKIVGLIGIDCRGDTQI